MAAVLLESVVPEEVPGRDASGTEEVLFVPVAVIGVVGFQIVESLYYYEEKIE